MSVGGWVSVGSWWCGRWMVLLPSFLLGSIVSFLLRSYSRWMAVIYYVCWFFDVDRDDYDDDDGGRMSPPLQHLPNLIALAGSFLARSR